MSVGKVNKRLNSGVGLQEYGSEMDRKSRFYASMMSKGILNEPLGDLRTKLREVENFIGNCQQNIKCLNKQCNSFFNLFGLFSNKKKPKNELNEAITDRNNSEIIKKKIEAEIEYFETLLDWKEKLDETYGILSPINDLLNLFIRNVNFPEDLKNVLYDIKFSIFEFYVNHTLISITVVIIILVQLFSGTGFLGLDPKLQIMALIAPLLKIFDQAKDVISIPEDSSSGDDDIQKEGANAEKDSEEQVYEHKDASELDSALTDD
ncbi:MAG: hypothetical protein LBI81_02010 [Puniceicoccales bacterium]|jgi:hypothetical protein|nr:hypothetical protein [Puniceicoccales bacterium]